jgi:hypothetical protein
LLLIRVAADPAEHDLVSWQILRRGEMSFRPLEYARAIKWSCCLAWVLLASACHTTLASSLPAGFAIDPQFNLNGYVYLFCAVDPQHLWNCDAPPSGAPDCRETYRAGQHAVGGATIARLVRYRFFRPIGDGDFLRAEDVDYATWRVLIGEIQSGGAASNGCLVTEGAHGPGGLAFGNNRPLLADCGDGASLGSIGVGSGPDSPFQQGLDEDRMDPAENVGADAESPSPCIDGGQRD